MRAKAPFCLLTCLCTYCYEEVGGETCTIGDGVRWRHWGKKERASERAKKNVGDEGILASEQTRTPTRLKGEDACVPRVENRYRRGRVGMWLASDCCKRRCVSEG
ncbi:hypothetical protein BKA81DRAFT_357846 [Phyllosticta paracitricarpa]